MRKTPASAAGFSLIEVMLAMSIAVFCLIPLLGLLPVGLKTHQTANEQTRLVAIASMIVQDLENTPSTKTTTPRFKFTLPTPAAGGDTAPQTLYLDSAGATTGSVGGSPSPNAFYSVNLSFTPPTAGQRTATAIRVMITWPALADRTPGQWPTHYTGIFQTVVALDRN